MCSRCDIARERYRGIAIFEVVAENRNAVYAASGAGEPDSCGVSEVASTAEATPYDVKAVAPIGCDPLVSGRKS